MTRQSDIDRLYQIAQNYNTSMPGSNQDIPLGQYNSNNPASLAALANRIIGLRRSGYIPSRGNTINYNGVYGFDAGYVPMNYNQYGFSNYGY